MRKWPLLVALVAACGATAAPNTTNAEVVTTGEATTMAPVTTEPATTTTEETTTVAADAAPPELAGRWESEYQGERLILSLTGTSHTFQVAVFGLNVGGKISVEGNQIRFLGDPSEPGDGLYEWRVEGDTLTFAELEPPDANGSRRVGLTEHPFTRLG